MDFEHAETTHLIDLPDYPDPVTIAGYSTGILGSGTCSKVQAMNRGKAWMQSQLQKLSDSVRLPLPYAKDNEFECQPAMPGTWRRTGWIDNSYTIIDKGRKTESGEEVCLKVSLAEEDFELGEDGEKYETDQEPDIEDTQVPEA